MIWVQRKVEETVRRERPPLGIERKPAWEWGGTDQNILDRRLPWCWVPVVICYPRPGDRSVVSPGAVWIRVLQWGISLRWGWWYSWAMRWTERVPRPEDYG